MPPEVFTKLDILPDAPPVKIKKPWFALGWVIGVFWAALATAWVVGVYGISALPPKGIIVGVVILWLIALFKYFKCVRYIELYTDMVLVYTHDPIKPASQFSYDMLSVVLDLNEVFIIRKAQFTGGYSLKHVYWQTDWDVLNQILTDNASYVMRNYIQKPRGGFDPNTIPGPFPAMQTRNRGFGILGLLMVLYEAIVGVLLFVPYQFTQNDK